MSLNVTNEVLNRIADTLDGILAELTVRGRTGYAEQEDATITLEYLIDAEGDTWARFPSDLWELVAFNDYGEEFTSKKSCIRLDETGRTNSSVTPASIESVHGLHKEPDFIDYPAYLISGTR
jgi:hypothetical protein